MPLDRVTTPAGGDDLASTDEVKVYKDEGEEDENKASENLSEDKIGLVTETEEVKNSEEELPLFLQNSESGDGTHLLVDYRIGGRLPFPLFTPYPYSYGSPLSLGGISINAGNLPLYMCNRDVFSNPRSLPSAHLGLSSVPWHLPTHEGLPPPSPFLYGIVAPSSPPPPPSSILSLSLPYRQFPHPFYPGDLANPIAWSNPSIALTSAYHTSRLGHRPSSSSLLDAPVSPGTLCSYHRARSSLRGGKPSQVSSSIATSAFLGQHRRRFSHHSMDSFSTGSTTMSSNINISSIYANGRNLTSASSSTKPFLLSSPSSATSVGKLPHIKKPLNAFMIFMKEMRQRVIEECTLKESAAINQILGRKWHSLDRTEQAKYYELARREKELHRRLYPTWSARDNYALHSRRRRKRLHDDDRTTTDTDDDRECPNAKKCRARFGLEKQNQWCKPCRRKKRCIRFLRDGDTPSGMIEESEAKEERMEVEREATKKEKMQTHCSLVSV